MKNNILISGITGFVGSNLKSYLERKGYRKIIGVSRSNKLKSNIISYEDCNLDVFNDSKVFIHLAGKAHDLKKVVDEKEYFEVNTELTKTLFDKFLESQCEVFIFMSSVKAVADSVDGVLDEEAIPNPKTVYGKSKLKAEQYILKKELPDNKRVYILRPCMIHGPNNKGNLNLLYKMIKSGVPYPLGAFDNKRSFLSVDNLSYIIQKLMVQRPISTIYNVADDQPISTNELVKIIGQTVNKNTIIFRISRKLINFAAKLGDILLLPLTTDRLQKLTENYVVSNLKLKKELSEKLPLSTEEGIKKTISSFKN